MLDALRVIAAGLAVLLIWIGAFWFLGNLWDRASWIREGRPVLDEDEQLLADVWIANGWSASLARRKAHGLGKQARWRLNLLDTQDLMTNPSREEELRLLAPDAIIRLLNMADSEPVKQSAIETILEQQLEGQSDDMSARLLSRMRNPQTRLETTGLLGDLFVSAFSNATAGVAEQVKFDIPQQGRRETFSALEEAIIEILSKGDLRMPSHIVGCLRERFEPSTIRPALEDMHKRRIIAAHRHAYCLPENVDQIRVQMLESLQFAFTSEELRANPDSRELFDRLWEENESWTGFDVDIKAYGVG